MTQPPKRLVEGGGELREAPAIGSLLSRLPSDAPATEEVWRLNVWRRLEEPGRAKHRWFLFALPAAVTAVGLYLLFWAPRLSRAPSAAAAASAYLQMTGGHVFTAGPTAEPSQPWRETQAGESLLPASKLRTDNRSRAVLDVGGIAAVLLQPGSELSLTTIGPRTLLQLEGGGLAAHVKKRPPGEPFVVELRGYRVTVVGTVFSVWSGEGGEVRVGVSEGVVQVDGPRGGSWRVRAGESWSSLTSMTQLQEVISAGDRKILEGASTFDGSQSSLRAAIPAETALSDSGSHDALLAVLENTPARPSLSAPVPPQSMRSAGPSERQSETPPTPVPIPAAAAAPDSYAQAKLLATQGRFAAAAAKLEGVVERHEARADLALYELGRLRQRQLGDLAGALKAFEQYRTDFPAGPLQQEVSLSIIETELSRSDTDSAFSEVNRFLRGYADSERAAEVHLIKGNLLRARGKCKAAIDEYRSATRESVADDALYFTAFCQEQLGERSLAKDSLNDYLQRFPSGAHQREARSALGSP